MLKILLFILTLLLSLHGEEKLKVGLHVESYNGRIPEKDVKIGLEVFLRELSDEQEVNIEFTFYENDKLLAQDFISGKLNYITANPMSYALYIPKALLDRGASSYHTTKADSSELLMLSRQDDARPLRTLLQSKIASNGEKVSNIYLKTLMLEHNITREPDILKTETHHKSILKLFFSKADLCIIDRSTYNTATELNPQLKRKLKIIQSYHVPLNSITFTRKSMSETLRNKVIAFNKVLNDTTRGQQLLQMFRTKRMEISYPDELDPVYELLERYERLQKSVLQGRL